VGRDFPSRVIWIFEVAMLSTEIVTFSFASLIGGYAAFYLVTKVPIAIYLLLTRGLL
jgi:hypothetical protein